MSQSTPNLSSVHAVVLAGGADFGRCRLTSRLPASFWPVLGKPALVQVLEDLAGQGIRRATVCYSGDRDQVKGILAGLDGGLELDIVSEIMPLGTGGCLREAARRQQAPVYFLCQGNLAAVPQLAPLLAGYGRTADSLSVLINGQETPQRRNRKVVAGYLCGPAVVKLIPDDGYCDIKEALVPKLAKMDRPVQAIALAASVGPFRDWPGYLRVTPVALARFFARQGLTCDLARPAGCVWREPTAQVAAGARVIGPVALLAGAVIEEQAVVIGPAVIGRSARVGAGALVDSSVLWDEAQVGPRAQVQRCLLTQGTNIPAGQPICDSQE